MNNIYTTVPGTFSKTDNTTALWDGQEVKLAGGEVVTSQMPDASGKLVDNRFVFPNKTGADFNKELAKFGHAPIYTDAREKLPVSKLAKGYLKSTQAVINKYKSDFTTSKNGPFMSKEDKNTLKYNGQILDSLSKEVEHNKEISSKDYAQLQQQETPGYDEGGPILHEGAGPIKLKDGETLKSLPDGKYEYNGKTYERDAASGHYFIVRNPNGFLGKDYTNRGYKPEDVHRGNGNQDEVRFHRYDEESDFGVAGISNFDQSKLGPGANDFFGGSRLFGGNKANYVKLSNGVVLDSNRFQSTDTPNQFKYKGLNGYEYVNKVGHGYEYAQPYSTQNVHQPITTMPQQMKPTRTITASNLAGDPYQQYGMSNPGMPSLNTPTGSVNSNNMASAPSPYDTYNPKRELLTQDFGSSLGDVNDYEVGDNFTNKYLRNKYLQILAGQSMNLKSQKYNPYFTNSENKLQRIDERPYLQQNATEFAGQRQMMNNYSPTANNAINANAYANKMNADSKVRTEVFNQNNSLYNEYLTRGRGIQEYNNAQMTQARDLNDRVRANRQAFVQQGIQDVGRIQDLKYAQQADKKKTQMTLDMYRDILPVYKYSKMAQAFQSSLKGGNND